MAAAGSATGCVNPRSKTKVVPSSLLENVDADKPLPRRYSLGMDEFVDKSAYTVQPAIDTIPHGTFREV